MATQRFVAAVQSGSRISTQVAQSPFINPEPWILSSQPQTLNH